MYTYIHTTYTNSDKTQKLFFFYFLVANKNFCKLETILYLYRYLILENIGVSSYFKMILNTIIKNVLFFIFYLCAATFQINKYYSFYKLILDEKRNKNINCNLGQNFPYNFFLMIFTFPKFICNLLTRKKKYPY